MNEATDSRSSPQEFTHLCDAIERSDCGDVRSILKRLASTGDMSFSQMDSHHMSTLASKLSLSNTEIMNCFIEEDALSVFGHKLIFFFAEIQWPMYYSDYPFLYKLLDQIDCPKYIFILNNFIEETEIFLSIWKKVDHERKFEDSEDDLDNEIAHLCSMLSRHCCPSKVIAFMEELIRPNEMNECSFSQTKILPILYKNFGQSVLQKNMEGLKGVDLNLDSKTLLTVLNCLPVSGKENESLYTTRSFLDDHKNLASSLSDIRVLMDEVMERDIENIEHRRDLFNIFCDRIFCIGMRGMTEAEIIINPVISKYVHTRRCYDLLKLGFASSDLILVNPRINWEVADMEQKVKLRKGFKYILHSKHGRNFNTWTNIMTMLLKKVCNDSFVFRQFVVDYFDPLSLYHGKCADFLQSQVNIFTEHVINQPRTLQYLSLRRVQQRMPIENLIQPIEKQAKLLGIPKYVLDVPPIFTSDGFNVATKLTENVSEFIIAGGVVYSDSDSSSDRHSYSYNDSDSDSDSNMYIDNDSDSE